MNIQKTAAIVFLVLLAGGAIGFLWGRHTAPQEVAVQDGGNNGATTSALKSQHTMIQEILVTVTTMQQTIDRLSRQQAELTKQYKQYLAATPTQSPPQSGEKEATGPPPPPGNALTVLPQQKMEELLKQQQELRESPMFQEMRAREKEEAMEWTDSLDPSSPPSDG